MAKYKKKSAPSTETIDEALNIAKSIQRPNQTKEQTKLIAQGIQKGISEYKKRQKIKARALEKQKKRVTKEKDIEPLDEASQISSKQSKLQLLPWSLLVITWIAMGVYFVY